MQEEKELHYEINKDMLNTVPLTLKIIFHGATPVESPVHAVPGEVERQVNESSLTCGFNLTNDSGSTELDPDLDDKIEGFESNSECRPS
jgi:hypothetical protein